MHPARRSGQHTTHVHGCCSAHTAGSRRGSRTKLLSRHVARNPQAIDGTLERLVAVDEGITDIDLDPSLIAPLLRRTLTPLAIRTISAAQLRRRATPGAAASPADADAYLGLNIAIATGLKTVLLSRNSIAYLEGVVQFRSVVRLSLLGNQVRTISDCTPLGALEKLHFLSLEHNPVTSLPLYREHLIVICSAGGLCRLKQLDSRRVSASSMKAARDLLDKEHAWIGSVCRHYSLLLHLRQVLRKRRLHDELRADLLRRGLTCPGTTTTTSSRTVPQSLMTHLKHTVVSLAFGVPLDHLVHSVQREVARALHRQPGDGPPDMDRAFADVAAQVSVDTHLALAEIRRVFSCDSHRRGDASAADGELDAMLVHEWNGWFSDARVLHHYFMESLRTAQRAEQGDVASRGSQTPQPDPPSPIPRPEAAQQQQRLRQVESIQSTAMNTAEHSEEPSPGGNEVPVGGLFGQTPPLLAKRVWRVWQYRLREALLCRSFQRTRRLQAGFSCWAAQTRMERALKTADEWSRKKIARRSVRVWRRALFHVQQFRLEMAHCGRAQSDSGEGGGLSVSVLQAEAFERRRAVSRCWEVWNAMLRERHLWRGMKGQCFRMSRTRLLRRAFDRWTSSRAKSVGGGASTPVRATLFPADRTPQPNTPLPVAPLPRESVVAVQPGESTSSVSSASASLLSPQSPRRWQPNARPATQNRSKEHMLQVMESFAMFRLRHHFYWRWWGTRAAACCLRRNVVCNAELATQTSEPPVQAAAMERSPEEAGTGEKQVKADKSGGTGEESPLRELVTGEKSLMENGECPVATATNAEVQSPPFSVVASDSTATSADRRVASLAAENLKMASVVAGVSARLAIMRQQYSRRVMAAEKQAADWCQEADRRKAAEAALLVTNKNLTFQLRTAMRAAASSVEGACQRAASPAALVGPSAPASSVAAPPQPTAVSGGMCQCSKQAPGFAASTQEGVCEFCCLRPAMPDTGDLLRRATAARQLLGEREAGLRRSLLQRLQAS